MKTKTTRAHSSRPVVSARLALAVTIATALPASAVDVIKDNNANALNLTTSWVGGVAPTAADIAVWNNTVVGANTTALGADLSFLGIRIVSPGGLATVTHAAGQTLTLGTSGIDLSAATQNLTLMSAAVANTAGTLAIGGAQTWNVAGGRVITLFSTSNSANQRLAGTGDITVTGGGTINMNVGDLGSTTTAAGNGNDTYTGNWTISGGKIVSLRNGTHAWGQGLITLNGGTISQNQGSWTWSNNIDASANSVIGTDSSNGLGRQLKLLGNLTSANSSDLTFTNFTTGGTRTAFSGIILAGIGASTYDQTNISANTRVRVGGTADLTITGVGQNAAARGSLGTGDVNLLAANAELGFTRSDAHTVANVITGTGTVTIGGVTGDGAQVVTLSGASNYTGTTTVTTGRLNLTGSLTSATSVAATGAISGTGITTGLLTTNTGASIFLAGGGTTNSLTSNGVTFGGATIARFLAAPVAATTYDILTFGGGAVTNPANLSVFAHGTLSQGATKFTFLADGAQTRTWDGVTGTWLNGGATDLWQEGDQDYYDLDTVTFNEPGAASTVTLSGMLSPTSVTVSNTTNTYIFDGTDGTNAIAGTSTLTKTGSGTLILDSAHTYAGATTVSGGILDIGNGGTTGALGSGAVSVGSSGQVVFNRSNAFTVSNTISGAGLVTKKGAGRMTVNGNNSGGTVNWNFTGTGNGDIGFQNANAVGATGSTITIQAGATGSAFFATTGNTTDVGIALGAASVITWNGSTGFTNTLSGVISGDGAFTKVSGETLLLTGINTYTGATTVNTGTLLVNGSISGSTTTVNGGTLGGIGTVGALNLNAPGTLAPGAGAGILNAGNTTFNGGTFALELNGTTAGSSYDQLNVTGTVSLASDTPITISLGYTPVNGVDRFTIVNNDLTDTVTGAGLFSFGGNTLTEGEQFTAGAQDFTISYVGGDGNDVVLAAVPEPSATLALLGGFGVLLGLRRRK